ncbi:putative Ig domain-containing protein [bacterium]|nr:putative Ig domain-containing protein [bacterium]
MKGLVFAVFILLTTFVSTGICAQSLTLTERIQAQEKIERVYYNHRLWPESNPDDKPQFELMVPRDLIEQKVISSMKNSDELRISPEMLQAEMNRIAKTTRDPEMLNELFAALNNDPFLIAETLVQPSLAARTIRKNKNPFSSNGSPTYKLPSIIQATCEGWEPMTAINPPEGRAHHSTIWTGTEMIVWGGGPSGLNTGGRFDPALNTWTPTPIDTNTPAARYSHTAVWTGSEMIVWGGFSVTLNELNTGGGYNPVSDTWTATSVAGAPSARFDHVAVWTGTEMIVTKGQSQSAVNAGGRYNPSTNSWQSITSDPNNPAEMYGTTAVWTGQYMVIWGGFDGNNALNTGGRYNPSTNSWLPTLLTNAPDARFGHSAVWTGSEMIVWGGSFQTAQSFNSGGRYNPVSDSWQPTSTAPGVPFPRTHHTAVWTGSEMIIWAGQYLIVTRSGGRYSPATDSWKPTAVGPNSPEDRIDHGAVWDGSKMIIWGGSKSNKLNTGGLYSPDTDFIDVSPLTLPNGEINGPYTQTLTASGGTAPYFMTLPEGQLPLGLMLDSLTGTVSGTPTEENFVALIFTPLDVNGCAGSRNYALTICPLLVLSPSTLPQGDVGVSYLQTISVSGGMAPYTFSVTAGALPAGLTLNPTTGVISGTPTMVETANFTITAVDAQTCAKSKDYTIDITDTCLLCDDFEDGVMDPNWTVVKTSWNESGGSLNGIPARKKAIIIATPLFSGCQTCFEESAMMTAGGIGNKISMLGWYVDKNNLMALQFKEESDKIVLKQRVNGKIVAKAKASFTIDPNISYIVKVSYDGTIFTVYVDNSPLFTLIPAAPVPSGTVGFQAKNTTASFGYITVN